MTHGSATPVAMTRVRQSHYRPKTMDFAAGQLTL